MYLTRFNINTVRRGARKLLASPQAMHAAVRAAFARPEDHESAGTRALWRLDYSADSRVTLYLASPGRPDLTHLVEQAGWPTTDTWDTRPYDGFLNSLSDGQTWAFRLTANPVRDGRKTSDSKDTQRFGAVTTAHQIEWLVSRAERNGFAILTQDDGNLNLMLHRRMNLSIVRARGERPVTLVTATYDGVLHVTDAVAFRRVLAGGLGHAKAYGCGLMTLAPAAR